MQGFFSRATILSFTYLLGNCENVGEKKALVCLLHSFFYMVVIRKIFIQPNANKICNWMVILYSAQRCYKVVFIRFVVVED